MAATISYVFSSNAANVPGGTFVVANASLASSNGTQAFYNFVENPDIVALANGGFSVSLSVDQIFSGISPQSGVYGTDPDAIQSRIFNFNSVGTPTQQRILFDNPANADPNGPDAIFVGSSTAAQMTSSRLQNGNIVNAWNETAYIAATNSYENRIMFSIFNPATATFVTQRVQLSGFPQDRLPSVTSLQNGNFVITYRDNTSVINETFNANGTLQGRRQANTTGIADGLLGSFAKVDPDVTGLVDGGYVVSWFAFTSTYSGGVARIFNADGTARTGEIRIGAALDGSISVYAKPNGDWALINKTGAAQEGRLHLYSSNGVEYTPPGGTLLHGGSSATYSANVLANGFIGVAANSNGQIDYKVFDRSGAAISFNIDGGAATDFFRIEAFGTGGLGGGFGGEYFADQAPSVATLADGRILAAWADSDTQTNGTSYDIDGRVMDLFRLTRGDASGDFFIGDDLRDNMIGNGGADEMHALGGNDILDGGAGNDTIDGGAGSNVLLGGGGRDVATYAFASTAATITRTGNDTWRIVNAAAGVSDSLSGIEVARFADRTVALREAARGDFDGEGTSDLVLQNGGSVVDWIIQNGRYQSGNAISSGATGFVVVGKGDLDSDGDADLVLQNGATVVDWIMQGGTYQRGNVITSAASGFTVRGAGDFDNDGDADLILQNGGTVVAWIMQNGVYQSGSVIATGATGFNIVGLGDVDGDGDADVVLQNGGTVVDWIMENGTYRSGNVISTSAAGNNVVGVGDFNGDGTADIALQSGGVVTDWIMQGGRFLSSNVVSTGASGFTVVGTGDLNNDGTADLTLQNGGIVVDWLMRNGTYLSGNVITTGATGFSVV